MTLLLAFSSLIVGVLCGATGVGGVLLIPALMFFGGLTTHQAMATALASFFFVGVAASYIYYRHGSFDLRMTAPVVLGSLLSGYAGAYAGALASARFLDLLLAAVIVVSSLYATLPFKTACLAERLSQRGNTILLFGIGLLTGFICGMTGAGGGVVSIPVMLLCGYAPLPVIATGQLLLCVISFSGSFSNIANDFIVFRTVWWVTPCEIAGIALGCRIAHSMPLDGLKRGITLFCLGLGLFMIAKTLFS